MYQVVLVRYGEIGLKGMNRRYFEDLLVRRVKQSLDGLPPRPVYRTHGRVLVETRGDAEEVMGRLRRVFGVVSFSPAIRAPLDLQSIQDAAVSVMADAWQGPGETFKVQARRANKAFPYDSLELNHLIGGYVLPRFPGLRVDVHQPSHVLQVEVREEEAYVYSRVVPGPGGLPVGSSGRAVLLLSGGIDSPVAGWMAMKRGLELEAIHFYSFPFTGEKSREKVIDLCRVLALYGGRLRLWVAYFTEAQRAVQLSCPEELRVTVMRRIMFRIAQRAAERAGALALVTGESLGQVASQTLESISVIQAATTLPVLRPLIGMDKTEITALARKIGTYEISIRPYEDCCALFVPRHPRTRPRREQVEEAERSMDVEALVEEALEKSQVLDLTGRAGGGEQDG